MVLCLCLLVLCLCLLVLYFCLLVLWAHLLVFCLTLTVCWPLLCLLPVLYMLQSCSIVHAPVPCSAHNPELTFQSCSDDLILIVLQYFLTSPPSLSKLLVFEILVYPAPCFSSHLVSVCQSRCVWLPTGAYSWDHDLRPSPLDSVLQSCQLQTGNSLKDPHFCMLILCLLLFCVSCSNKVFLQCHTRLICPASTTEIKKLPHYFLTTYIPIHF